MADDATTPQQTSDPNESPALRAEPGDLERPGAMSDDEAAATDFPIVGLGASAGGIAALSAFFDALPPQNGLAVVIVQHLSPDHESELAEILQNHTFMRVEQVTETPEVRPGNVYVIPPGKSLTIREGRLHLGEPEQPRHERAPINLFFRSLAEDLGDRAVAVVLSGTGADGAQGLARVKERGGLTLAQAPEEAEYTGMPQAAIRTGLVDFVAPAAELARKLVGLKEEAGLVIAPEEGPLPQTDAEALSEILRELRNRTRHDFANYKRSTLLRRIQRRMQMTHSESLPDYLSVLRGEPDEPRELLKDLLISVTSFFRDPEAFVALENLAVRRIAAEKRPGDVIRAWVPGCATGEEAYTVAMLLCEHAPENVEVQVFATDIDEDAIAVARAGEYPMTIEADVSTERLRRFFEPTDTGFRVREPLRKTVLFAPHNLLSDPPFSSLDLITCRNLLIYVQREAQSAVFERFAYALRADGYLFLGSSETAEDELFEPVEKKLRLYSPREITASTRPLLAAARSARTSSGFTPRRFALLEPAHEDALVPLGVEALYEAWTLQQHTPPRLLVGPRGEVTHLFGGAGRFLTEGEGRVTQDVISRIVRPLRAELRVALHEAQDGKRASSPYIRTDGEIVRLRVGPVEAPDFPEGAVEVVFEVMDAEAVEALGAGVQSPPEDERAAVERVEAELRRTREKLQETIEESGTGQEELRASNEELQSLNEELQSATEELETSKEELQSMNEELVTVNQELRTKVEEVNRAYSDLVNLMQATDIGTLFLDRELRIKRFTDRATEIFHLRPGDVGRPLDHIAHRLQDLDLGAEAEQVLSTLVPIEREVGSEDGRWYLFRLLPYRTVGDQISGVVASFFDVTPRRLAEEEVERRAEQQAAVADLGRLALTGRDLDGLLHATCQRVSETLGTDYTKVLRHRRETSDLLLVSGCGWNEGLVGTGTVGDGRDSQAGFTLERVEPVVVTDFAHEDRFTAPPLLTDHGVQSGMSVIIPGDGRPWGVLGTHAREPNDFSERDAHFLQAVANVLAEALRRDATETRLRDLADEAARHAAEMDAVIEAIPDGIYIGDIDGIRYANSVALRFADVGSVEEFQEAPRALAQTFALRDPETGEPLPPEAQPFLRALGGEVAIRDLLATHPATGRDLFVRFAAAPIRLGDETIGAVGVSTDRSERRRLEQDLAESAAVIRGQLAEITAVYDSAPLGLSVKDREMRYIRINERLAEINGLPAEDHIGRTTAELFPELAEQDDPHFQRVLDTGEPGPRVKYSAPAPADPDVPRDWVVQHFPVTSEAGEVVAVGTVVQDLTDIRRAQEELGQSQARLETLQSRLDATLGRLPTGVLITERTADGALDDVYANPAAFEIVRGTPLLATPDRFNDFRGVTLFDSANRPLSFDRWPLGRALAGEVVVGEEIRVPREDGSWLVLLVNAAPMQSDSDETTAAVVAFEDITARLEAESRVRALNETLESRVAKRTQQVRRLALALTLAEQRERSRVAQILHDNVQQVLHGVRLRIELLASSLPEADQAREVQELLGTAIEITRTLSVDLAPPVLEGGGIAEGLEWLARQMHELHGLTVRVQAEPLPQELPRETVTLLLQLVRELLFNVAKHAGVKDASVVVAREAGGLRLDIVDHGRGFNPDDVQEGFGLVSVRERVDLLGGALEIASQEGGGTRTTLRLP